MAHFAQIDENGNVLQVVVIDNNDIANLPFPDSEELGVAFCKTLFGEESNWVQTSYNNSFRARFAAIGGLYDAARDIFVAAPPLANMTYDHTTGLWVDPEIESVRSIVDENKDALPTDEDIMARMIAMRNGQ
jgi:hypothetical protein